MLALRSGVHRAHTVARIAVPKLIRGFNSSAKGWELSRRALAASAFVSCSLWTAISQPRAWAHSAPAGLTMASALANADLATPDGRLAAAKATADEVYGRYTGPDWRPKPYEEEKGRYLWTDAFGVVNYISLACETGDSKYLDQADILIQEVHDTLGRDRSWRHRLGGATDEEPTRGGLRIGKKHPEGHPDGDGQYFHYLTKWAFALNRMGLARGDKKYNDWAVQLVQTTHPHFVAGRGTARPRMFWKISIDMSRPMVPSEGNLDPFDGLVTYRLLREAAGGGGVLREEIADMERMVANKHQRYHSEDPLDLGEALWLSHWGLAGGGGGGGEEWAQLVARRSLAGLEQLWEDGYFSMPAKFRLAFREFGTALGVQVNPLAGPEWRERAAGLHRYWTGAGRLFSRDKDITPVMLCSSLVPGAWAKDYPALRRLSQHSEL